MDPDKILETIRKSLEDIRAHEDGEPLPSGDDDITGAQNDLADAIESLDAWLSVGGFLPEPWKGAR